MYRISLIAIIVSSFTNIVSAGAADNLHCMPPYQKIADGLAANVPTAIARAPAHQAPTICVSIDQSKSITSLQCTVESNGSLYQCPDDKYCEPGLGLYNNIYRTADKYIPGTTQVCINYGNTTGETHILRVLVNMQ